MVKLIVGFILQLAEHLNGTRLPNAIVCISIDSRKSEDELCKFSTMLRSPTGIDSANTNRASEMPGNRFNYEKLSFSNWTSCVLRAKNSSDYGVIYVQIACLVGDESLPVSNTQARVCILWMMLVPLLRLIMMHINFFALGSISI